jgi:hypothetical protein
MMNGNAPSDKKVQSQVSTRISFLEKKRGAKVERGDDYVSGLLRICELESAKELIV